MPPQLALLLCAALVLFLLRVERRNSPDVSRASWIPTLWMLAIASKPLGIWFGTSGDNEAGSGLDRLLLTGLTVCAVVVLVRRRFDCAGALRRHAWLVALLAYMLVSTLWSEVTAIALRRLVRDAIVVIMAMVIMSDTNPRLALESLLRRSAYILIPFSLVLIKYYPLVGVEYARWSGEQMWVGVTLHKNSLGRMCLVSAFFLLWALYRRWQDRAQVGTRYLAPADLAVLFIALFLLKGSEHAYSATSIGTFAVGIATFLGLLWLRNQKLAIPAVALLAFLAFSIGYGISAPFLEGSNLATFSSLFGRNETLTGRTDVWAQLVPVVKRQPLLGSGFGSFWTTARRELYQMSHGHNGYLDILLELGAVGLALYTAWLLSCARKLRVALLEDDTWATMAISFLVMAVVYNATESAFSSFGEQMAAVVVLVSLVVPYEPIRTLRGSHLRLRLHLPPQRVTHTIAAQPRPSANGEAVRILDRRGGQRRGRVRT